MSKLDNNFIKIPKITSKRLILDHPIQSDFKKLEVFLKSERSKYIGGPYSSFTSWADFMANIGHWTLYGYGLWSVRIKKNNEFIGRVGIIKPLMFNEPDLAWQLFEKYEGKGYALEAAKTILNYILNNINILQLASHILENNKKSISLANKLGVKKIEKQIIDNKKFVVYFHKF